MTPITKNLTKRTLLSVITAALLLAGGGLYVSAGWARVMTTSGDRTMSLDVASSRNYGSSTDGAIILHPESINQEIDGFGYAITYSSCVNLLRMPAQARKELLTRTFSHEQGYGVSYVRISIGCNDFSSDEYTLCDRHDDNTTRHLRHFALHDDEISYVIPILKEILSINPSLKIIAAPWTPPRWMKYHEERGESPDSDSYGDWTGGRLRPKYYRVYGEYFVEFIRAMALHGIAIHAVSPQNEPLNWGNSASCYMPYTDMADFVSTGLAPALDDAGLQTRIYIYDHNYNYDNMPDQSHYPILAYDRMGSGFAGEHLVAGACYHSYGGSVDDIKEDVVWGAWQDRQLIFTEASIGTWNDGRNLWKRLAADMDELVISTTLNRFKASLVWNFMLDTDRSPHRPAGCSTCYGAIDLDVSNPDEYTYNSHYYIMAHASDAVKPDARRIDTDGWWADGVSYAAFVNPDNTTAILMANRNDRDIDIKVHSSGQTYIIKVPSRGIVSARMGYASDPLDSSILTPVPDDDPSMGEEEPGGYDLSGRKVATPDQGTIYITPSGKKRLGGHNR